MSIWIASSSGIENLKDMSDDIKKEIREAKERIVILDKTIETVKKSYKIQEKIFNKLEKDYTKITRRTSNPF